MLKQYNIVILHEYCLFRLIFLLMTIARYLPLFRIPLLFTLLAALFASSADAVAQMLSAKEKLAFFARGGINFVSHNSGFGTFVGPADCASLQDGKGSGFSGTIGVELPLFSKSFLGIGIGFTNFGGKSSGNSVFNSRDTTSGELTPVTLQTNLTAAMQYAALHPEFNTILIEKLLGGPLRLSIGTSAFIPLSASFDQTENIISPANAAFIANGNRLQQRTIAKGDIKTIKVLFGISAGIENMIPLSSRLYCTQQIGADFPLNNATSDTDWKMHGLRAEIGLRYALHTESTQPIISPPPPPPPLPSPPKHRELSPALSITLKKVDLKGKEGRELIASPPIVNAVFFEQNSAVIPSKYSQKELSGAIPSDALEFHRYIIPYIAKILSDNPRGKVELYGATSGDDESRGVELAQQRADAVRNILISLGIAKERISVAADVNPAVKSSQDLPEGREENRRTDIIVRNVRLQEYVSRQNYADISGAATMEIIAEDLASDSIITVKSPCFSTPLIINSGGTFTVPLHCRTTETSGAYSLQVEAISKNLSATDFYLSSLGSIEKTGEDVYVNNFDAVLRFNYNSDELSAENKELLRQMIEKMPSGTIITIYGSADAIGTQQRNIQLEKNRASNTEQFIRSISGNTFTIHTAQGTDKFPENTPEGRFLNRNMRIRLEK